MKKLSILFALAALLLGSAGCGRNSKNVDVHEMAVKVSEKGLSRIDLGHYMGTCLYHGMADLALASGEKADMDRITDILQKFADGTFEGPIFANFIDYEVGGQATAMLAWKGQESLEAAVRACAAKMWAEQPRTVTTGIMTGRDPYWAENDAYWIDIAFTVSPFFLYAGLLEGNREYVDYAAYEALAMCRQLYDPATDLYHQGFRHPNSMPEMEISEDNWSRGNGWMSMALGTLIRDYPHDGRYWDDIVSESRRFYSAICRVQDENGMWRQEMSNPESYVETSGSGQLLAGLGAAIEAGILDRKEYLPFFEKGLKGLLGYIDPDGSIGHTCMGNCVPGKGFKKDFEAKHWYYNESHSFGPAVLALSQALRLGFKEVMLDAPPGSANDPDRPRTHVALSAEGDKDLAWENDRIAFRVYSKDGKSGVDVWAKTVDYSIIDKWLCGDARLTDSGEGCDWYEPGEGRGAGGSGIWADGQIFTSTAFARCSIERDDESRIAFTLEFDPYEAAGEIITESKRIEMVRETSFYRVTHTVTTASGKDAILAVGLQSFGDCKVLESAGEGKLYLFETVHHNPPIGIGLKSSLPEYTETDFGSGILACPELVSGIESVGPDHLMLLNVHSGEPVTYYVGASFSLQENSGRDLGTAKYWKHNWDTNSWAAQEKFYQSR